jgi:hypothetical protein
MPFGVNTPFLVVIYANFLQTNLSVEIYAKIYAIKCLLTQFSSKEKSYIGLKKLFVLITPMQQFWSWRRQFYRIGSCVQQPPLGAKMGCYSEDVLSILKSWGSPWPGHCRQAVVAQSWLLTQF